MNKNNIIRYLQNFNRNIEVYLSEKAKKYPDVDPASFHTEYFEYWQFFRETKFENDEITKLTLEIPDIEKELKKKVVFFPGPHNNKIEKKLKIAFEINKKIILLLND